MFFLNLQGLELLKVVLNLRHITWAVGCMLKLVLKDSIKLSFGLKLSVLPLH